MVALKDLLKHPGPIRWDSGNETCRLGVPGESGELKEMLGDLQGNILTWHKRSHAHYFFLNFKYDSDLEKNVTNYLLSILATGVQRADKSEQMRAEMMQALKSGPGHEARKSGSGGSTNGYQPLILPKELFDLVKDLKITSEWDLRSRVESGGDMEKETSFFVSLQLTRRGYEKLGFKKNIEGGDAFFRGMENTIAELNDPPRSEWKLGAPHEEASTSKTKTNVDEDEDAGPDACLPVRQQDMDAMLILAYNPPRDTPNQVDVKDTVDAVRKTLLLFSSLVHEEFGRALKSEESDPRTMRKWYIEPFGFRDGISQPLFYESDRRNAGQATFGPSDGVFEKWDPVAPLDLVLVPDPNGKPLACGTFFVYRKLKQDVHAFYSQAQAIASASGLELHEVLANFMGRYMDGRLKKSDPDNAAPNDFDFKNDQSQSKCPFHAHIRKVNPRGDAGGEDIRSRRIARRALSFGKPMERDADNIPKFVRADSKKPPEGEHGLHFMCAQSDIARQFEYMQAKWANSVKSQYLRVDSGMDPLAGQGAGGAANRIFVPERIDGLAEEKWPPRQIDYRQTVSFQGGDYFFAPSISSLMGLFP